MTGSPAVSAGREPLLERGAAREPWALDRRAGGRCVGPGEPGAGARDAARQASLLRRLEDALGLGEALVDLQLGNTWHTRPELCRAVGPTSPSPPAFWPGRHLTFCGYGTPRRHAGPDTTRGCRGHLRRANRERTRNWLPAVSAEPRQPARMRENKRGGGVAHQELQTSRRAGPETRR
jgi:hypothetical protein